MKLSTSTLTNLVRALTLLLMVTPVTTAQVTVRNMIPRSWSAETNQDCEPNLAVNPANPLQIAGSAFTFDTATTTTMVGNLAPIFVSSDGGNLVHQYHRAKCRRNSLSHRRHQPALRRQHECALRGCSSRASRHDLPVEYSADQ